MLSRMQSLVVSMQSDLTRHSGTYCLENQGLTASRILSILYLIRYCVYRAPGVLPGIRRRAEQAAGAGEEVGGEETG